MEEMFNAKKKKKEKEKKKKSYHKWHAYMPKSKAVGNSYDMSLCLCEVSSHFHFYCIL